MGCDINAVIETRRIVDWSDTFQPWRIADEPEINRSYELFAFLADVRNDDGILPIAEPKGVPEDTSEVTSAWIEYNGSDGHSHSWLTLAELKAADLDQTYYDNRLITHRDAAGRITGTCRATTGHHEGPVGYSKLFAVFGRRDWDRLLADMETCKHDGQTDEDVRLVFWFDN